MVELTWETQNDWDAAQSRNGVISRGIGDNVGDALALGYDPNYGPLSDAVGYYTMDEESGSLVDVVGDNDMSVYGAGYGATGELGTTAISFDGSDDYAQLDTTTDVTGGGSFSFLVWGYFGVSSDEGGIHTVLRHGSRNAGTFWFDVRIVDDEFGFGYFYDGSNYNATLSAHQGSVTAGNHLVVGVYDESANEIRIYLNGVEETTSVGTETRPEETSGNLTLGHAPSIGRYLQGDIGSTILWDRALSSAEATTLYDTLSGGSLTTAAQSDSGAAEEITVDCTIPSSTSASATVHASDGTTETVSLTDGTNSYTLSNFSSLGSDGSYWITYDLNTSDPTVTPIIQTTTLSAATQHIFVVSMKGDFNGDGTQETINVPAYDPSNVSRSPVRFRNNSGVVGAARIIDHTTARMKVRHPTDGKLGLETKSQ